MLKSKADEIRKEVIRIAVKNQCGHIAPSLSCVDILVALYYEVMEPADRFILSKSHGGYGLYAILADKGILPKEKWENFDLPGCVERNMEIGIEAGCGSLGHGLPMAVGLAWGLKLQGKSGRVFCLMGDGECQEGTTWEAIQFAVHHKLDNLVVIVDDNKLQAMDFTENVIGGYLEDRFDGFGVSCRNVNGHDMDDLTTLFSSEGFIGTPKIYLCETVKGKSLPFMENIPKWHFRLPSTEEINDTEILKHMGSCSGAI